VANGGNLEVLMKWLREHNPPCPPWEEDTFVEADRGGNLEEMKWAREQDPPDEEPSKPACTTAVQKQSPGRIRERGRGRFRDRRRGRDRGS